jgi:hypothetical protein
VGTLAAFDESGRSGTETVPELAELEPELAVDEPELAADEPEPAVEEPEEPEAEPEPAVDEPEAVVEEVEEAEAEAADEPEPEEPEEEPEPEESEPEEPEPVSVRPQVEELFARIRADRSEAVDQARAVLATEPAPEPAPAPEQEPAPAPAVVAAVRAQPDDDTAEGDADEPDQDAALLEERDELLEPVHAELVRRCKRALQDEQNELLDRLRRQKGRTTAEELLIPLSVQVTDWADVLEPAVDAAYRAGRSAQENGASTGAPRRLVSGMAELVVTPLRERLVSTLDAVPRDEPDRVAELTSRVGARYREWRAQEIDAQAGDLLATAYVRGIYDAAPEGVLLRWVPAAATRCPDCDDNALEPTARGAPFPTGQPFPPAHPGCRCLLAVDDA